MWKTKRQGNDYTEEELRRILCERFQVARQERLKEFHRSGKTHSHKLVLPLNRPSVKDSKSQDRREQSWLSGLLKAIEVGILLGLVTWSERLENVGEFEPANAVNLAHTCDYSYPSHYAH